MGKKSLPKRNTLDSPGGTRYKSKKIGGLRPRLFPLISGLSVEINENSAKRFVYFHRFSLMW